MFNLVSLGLGKGLSGFRFCYSLDIILELCFFFDRMLFKDLQKMMEQKKRIQNSALLGICIHIFYRLLSAQPIAQCRSLLMQSSRVRPWQTKTPTTAEEHIVQFLIIRF